MELKSTIESKQSSWQSNSSYFPITFLLWLRNHSQLKKSSKTTLSNLYWEIISQEVIKSYTLHSFSTCQHKRRYGDSLPGRVALTIFTPMVISQSVKAIDWAPVLQRSGVVDPTSNQPSGYGGGSSSPWPATCSIIIYQSHWINYDCSGQYGQFVADSFSTGAVMCWLMHKMTR